MSAATPGQERRAEALTTSAPDSSNQHDPGRVTDLRTASSAVQVPPGPGWSGRVSWFVTGPHSSCLVASQAWAEELAERDGYGITRLTSWTKSEVMRDWVLPERPSADGADDA